MVTQVPPRFIILHLYQYPAVFSRAAENAMRHVIWVTITNTCRWLSIYRLMQNSRRGQGEQALCLAEVDKLTLPRCAFYDKALSAGAAVPLSPAIASP